MPQIRFLSHADVTAALTMPAAIASMKIAYQQFSTGNSQMPPRSRTPLPDDAVLLTMPAYLQQSDQLGVKIVSVVPQNVNRNLPTIYALVMAIDPHTGEPLAILEGGSLTAIRTGAGSGAATDALARRDAATVAIIGSGVQARTQLLAVCAVRPVERVFVYSRTADHARRFASEMSGRQGIPQQIDVTATPEEAVQQAAIVCTATTSHTPVFDGDALRPGTHINAVGSFTPQMQEVDIKTLQRATVFVDSHEAVLAEAGELIIAIEEGALHETDIAAEIGEVLNGTHAGRTSDDEITYFKSVGIAVQDAAAASLAFQQAQEQNLGTLVDL